MQRTSRHTAIRRAVEEGRLVIACAYPSHLPPEVLKALPEGPGTSQFIAIVNENRIEFRFGPPLALIEDLLNPHAPTQTEDSRKS